MIFPFPKSETYLDGNYQIKNFSNNFDPVYLFNKYKQGNESVELICNKSFEKEEYELEVNEDGIKITHFGECSFFRAVTTLSQLFWDFGKNIPFCHITDKPDFEKRAYMLDISRGKVPKVKAITQLIDILAGLKYNEFQLYMESFVFKYKAYPQVTEDFDCLTPEDIQFLDSYCKERFIELIPNQNSFGHLGDWLKRNEFKHMRVGKIENIDSATINPLLPESYEFIDNIYDSLLPNFSSDYVHVGFDEAYELGQYELKEPCEKYGKENIFMDWLCKIANLAKAKYNKKIQFWADMIESHPEAFKRMPEGAVAMVWGYDKIHTARTEEQCINMEKIRAEYYVCPGDSTWNSFTGRFDVMHFNVRLLAEMGHKHGAKGYMITSWGNSFNAAFPIWTYVPCALGALYSWDIGEVTNCNIKTADVRKAEEYVDKHIFKAPLSIHLRKLQKYHLFEPEPAHDGTFTMKTFKVPLDETVIYSDFDLCKYGQTLEADMIIEYMNRVYADVEKIAFDENINAQIYCNVKSVVFMQEFNKIRINKSYSDEKIEELVALAEKIMSIFEEQWGKDNFSKGKELFLEVMGSKRELEALKK